MHGYKNGCIVNKTGILLASIVTPVHNNLTKIMTTVQACLLNQQWVSPCHHHYHIGPSSKPTTQDKYPPGWMSQDDSEEKEDGEDSRPPALDSKQTMCQQYRQH